MWPFSKAKSNINHSVITLLPPLFGTFQEHAKVFKTLLPNITKKELEYVKSRWEDNDSIRFLSPAQVDKSDEFFYHLEDKEWMVQRRALDKPHCDCHNYYASSCCNGIAMGLHTNDNINVEDIDFPKTLFSRGSFIEELSEGVSIPLTQAEVDHFLSQGLSTTRSVKIVEVA